MYSKFSIAQYQLKNVQKIYEDAKEWLKTILKLNQFKEFKVH